MIKTKVGLFGGTFNPIHNGHLIIANHVRSVFRLDKIIFVPSYAPPHKTEFLPPEHRSEMVRRAIRSNINFEISHMEIDRGGESYTLDTLQYFLSLDNNKNKEVSFIIGSDAFTQIATWDDYKTLLSLCRFIVVTRPNQYQIDAEAEKECDYTIKTLGLADYNIEILSIPRIDISASYIRRSIRAKKSVQYLVPDIVIDYISEKNLYL